MTNIDIANGLVFQALGVSKESFDARLVSQKKVFLLQELGVDLGYSYNWYVRGPYSPGLSNYIFNNIDVLKEHDFSQYSLSASAKACVDQVNALVKVKPEKLSVPSWYELLASILYIHKKWKKENDYSITLQKMKKNLKQLANMRSRRWSNNA